MKKQVLVVIIIIALLLVANSATADIIYDCPYIGYNYLGGAFAGIYYSSNANPIDLDQGWAFTTPSVIDYILDGIEIPVFYPYGHGESELDVWLMADDSGLPGMILESFHFDSSEIGQVGYDNPLLVQNSLLQPILESDTQYWLVGSASGPDSYLYWRWNNSNIYAPHVVRWDMGDWNIEQMVSGAFSVYGTPVPSEVVPEPTSLILLGLGLAGMTLKGIKKRFLP